MCVGDPDRSPVGINHCDARSLCQVDRFASLISAARVNAIVDAVAYAEFYSRSHDDVIRVLRCRQKRDRDARARGRFQTVVSSLDPDLGRARTKLKPD